MKKKLVIFLIFLVCLVVIDGITVVPFATSVKVLMKSVKKQGDIGPYQDHIQDVRQTKFHIEVENYPDASVTLYSKESDHPLPLIVYIHGGGWVAGDASSVAFFGKLLSSNGYVVANVDYALAPKYPYPSAIVQLVEVLNYLYEHADQYGIDVTNVIIGGHSAGAHLSSQLGGLVTNSSYAEKVGVSVSLPAENLKGLLLLSGVYNMDTISDCRFPFLKKYLWAYTGTKQYQSYPRIDELSTIRYVTSEYPSTFITVGDIDPLASQTEEMMKVLEDNHIEYVPFLWENSNLYHDYIYHLNTHEARKVYQSIVSFLEKQTS